MLKIIFEMPDKCMSAHQSSIKHIYLCPGNKCGELTDLSPLKFTAFCVNDAKPAWSALSLQPLAGPHDMCM